MLFSYYFTAEMVKAWRILLNRIRAFLKNVLLLNKKHKGMIIMDKESKLKREVRQGDRISDL